MNARRKDPIQWDVVGGCLGILGFLCFTWLGIAVAVIWAWRRF